MPQNVTLFQKIPPCRHPLRDLRGETLRPSTQYAILSTFSAPLRLNGEFRQHVHEIIDLLFQSKVRNRDP